MGILNFWLKLKHAVQRTFLFLSHFYQQILKGKKKMKGRKVWCLKCGSFPNLSNVGDLKKYKKILCVVTVGDAADLN